MDSNQPTPSTTPSSPTRGPALHLTPEPAKPPFNVAKFALLFVASCALFTTIALSVLYAMGRTPIQQRSASGLRAEQVDVKIEWPRMALAAKDDKPKTWMPHQFQDQLSGIVRSRLEAHADPLSAVCIADVGRALESTGWFAGPPRVERRANASLHIGGSWRIPAAFVRWEGKDYLVGWDAKLLPPVYEPGQVTLRSIVGVSAPPPVDEQGRHSYSTPWPGEEVGAAVELLRTMAGRSWYSQVQGVDVAALIDRHQIDIITVYDTRVRWGGPASKPRPGETTTAGKLQKLDLLARDFKRIDTGRPAVDISLQSPPLEIDLSATATAKAQPNAKTADASELRSQPVSVAPHPARRPTRQP